MAELCWVPHGLTRSLFTYFCAKGFGTFQNIILMKNHEPLILLLAMTFPYTLIYSITQTGHFPGCLPLTSDIALAGGGICPQIFSCSDLYDLLTINFCLEKSRCHFLSNSLGKKKDLLGKRDPSKSGTKQDSTAGKLLLLSVQLLRWLCDL